MSDKSLIEWTDATWNPVTGCSIVSPGCTHCYAMTLAGGRLRHTPSRAGLTRDSKAGPVWTGEVRFNKSMLLQPLRWTRPRRIFVCAHGDLFAEGVEDAWIDSIFAVMALAPQHTFQVLTKRPARMRAYLCDPAAARRIYELACDIVLDVRPQGVVLMAPGVDERIAPPGRRVRLGKWPLPNVWLGVSVEDQRRANERIPELLATPAALRFLSCEPLLGPVDLGCVPWPSSWPRPIDDISDGVAPLRFPTSYIGWLIVGGESGPGARPMHPDWARDIRDQCARAGVPFFFKQHGAWAVTYDREQDDPDWRRCGDVERRSPHGQWLNLAGGQGFHGERVVRADRVGKKAAGRLLDGVEHNEVPT